MQLFPLWKGALHTLRGGAVWSARRAHNPKVGGSNPPPATKNRSPDLIKQAGLFIAGEFSGSKNFTPRPEISPHWKGPGSRRKTSFRAPFICPVDNLAGEFGGNLLEMSRGSRSYAVPAGGIAIPTRVAATWSLKDRKRPHSPRCPGDCQPHAEGAETSCESHVSSAVPGMRVTRNGIGRPSWAPG